MFDIKLESHDPSVHLGWGQAVVIPYDDCDVIIGKILTIIDAVGLPEQQNKALKDVVKNELRESLDVGPTGRGAMLIKGELHTLLRRFKIHHDRAHDTHEPVATGSGNTHTGCPCRNLTYALHVKEVPGNK